MSDYLDPIVVELEGRDRKFLDMLARAKAEIRRFTAEVGRMDATIKVDVKLKDGALAEVRRRVNESPAAKLKVDLQLAAGQRDQLRAQLEGRPIQANVRPVMDQTALRRVQTALRGLGRRIDVPIRPQMDDGAQRRAQRRLDRMSQDRTVVIRTRVIGDTNRVPRGGGSGGAAGGGGGGGALGALMTLAPALTPIAAQAAAVATAAGAATVAVGAFGVAVKSQLSSLGEAADAQTKYTAAVTKYGPASTQAKQAQQALTQTFAGMPAATRQAAAAFLILKSDFKSWSDGLAKFTMVPVTQGLGILDALLPRLSPLVKDTSVQFTRLTTMLAGGINSGAFDGLMKRFTTFTNGVLKNATDGVVHFVRVLSESGGGGTFSQFMAYAKQNAPLVKDTLKNLAEAVLNILKAASQAGPGMLSLVNTFAKLVAALPPSVIATLMQVAAALKLVKLAGAGFTALSGGVQAFAGRLVALRAASAAAGGGLAGLRAAFMSLSIGARAALITTGVGAIVVALGMLSSMGDKTPPDVDKVTTSLKGLAETGKNTGEAAKAWGTNFDGLSKTIARLNPKGFDGFLQGWAKFLGTDSTQVKTSKEDLDSLDKSLANLVQGGKADLAAKALEQVGKNLKPKAYAELKKNLDDYKSALADQALEQKLAAQSMGLFGDQAIAVQRKLDAQKQAVQGLQQAILDLNDANRAALDAESAYQQAIDDATAAIKGHRNALSMSNGQLDLGSQKARDAYGALSQLASSAEEAAKATLKQTGSQDKANLVLIDAHAQLVRVAKQMGLSSAQANTLADRLDNIKDPKIKISLYTQQAMSDLAAAKARVQAFPKSTRTKANFAYQQALADVRFYQRQVDMLHGKTVTVRINGVATGVNAAQYYSQGPHARGGPVRGYASGGDVQAFPGGGYVQGPGSGTSDSITAISPGGSYRVSNTEYVVQSSAVQKYGVRLLDALNAGHLKLAGYAKGGLTAAEKSARGQLAGGFGISTFGREAGYRRTSFERELAVPTDINALVSALNGFRSEIKAAFRGRTESSLLRQLDKAGKSLISYDKQLTKVTNSLASAKNKLDDLKNSAAQLKSSVAASVMQGAGIVTQAPQEGFALSSRDIVNNMAAELSKAATFSAQLQQLKKKGLSADLLEQIASAGVDQGGATAAALAGASDSTIKQLNSMQTQLKKSANAAGAAVSDQMYGAGIKAAEGLVKGLEKKQKAIEAAMLRIAKSMEKAIKAALKIKSPSQVMADVGDYTALGLAHGIRRSSKHAVIAAQGMAMSVTHGASLAGSPTWGGVPRGGGGAGVVVHQHFEFHVEGNVRTIEGLAKDIEQQFLRRGMRNPITYPSYKR